MRHIWPMGCKKTPDANKVEQLLSDPNYIAQPKIDGVRCILHFDSEGVAHYTTRGASLSDPGTPLDITHRLHHMRVRVRKLAGLELDGEIWAPHLTSAEVSGQINYKSTVEVDDRLKLCVFDVLAINGHYLEGRTLEDRLKFLLRISPVFKALPFLQLVPWAETEELKRDMLAEEFESGREGIVLKNLKAKYIPGKYDKDSKPSNNWYKVKKKDTIDVRITGSELPEQFYRDPLTGEYEEGRLTKPWERGWFGSITFEFCDLELGLLEGSTSGLTDHMKAVLSDGSHMIKSEYIGRVMEVEYMEKTTGGNLRHPRFVRLREEIEK